MWPRRTAPQWTSSSCTACATCGWTDAEAGKLFCLLEAPSAEAAAAVHLEAYGLLVERFYEVQEDR